MAHSKKGQPAKAVEPGKTKSVNLRPIDLERLAIAKERTGIDSETDVIRFLLADYVNRTNPAPTGEGSR